jgi:hypothetical protein
MRAAGLIFDWFCNNSFVTTINEHQTNGQKLPLFMGLKGSSPFPQKSTIKRYTFYTFIPDFFNRYFNTIFPPTPMSSK